jgi:cation diffusion facilitator CzcD-associated flavoprotein CzcO
MTDVLIVGGGPSGLLLAQQFREHGIEHRVVERGKIGQAWRAMRPGMTLLSPSVPGTDWTSLRLDYPVWAVPGAKKPFPTREDFLCYVESFTREFKIRVEENTAASRAVATPAGFRVLTTQGDVPCRFLVIASGGASRPSFPRIPGIESNPVVLHSCDFVPCLAYDGRRVLVIGAGNSAAETAIALAGTAQVTMCTRRPMRYFIETGRLNDIRGSSESLLKELFQFGIVRLREANPVVKIAGGRAFFRSGEDEEFDWIICATGYRPAWIPLKGGEVRINMQGFPFIARTGESTVPGLYFCGSLARFNHRCAFIHGFRNYIEKIFWDIADRL